MVVLVSFQCRLDNLKLLRKKLWVKNYLDEAGPWALRIVYMAKLRWQGHPARGQPRLLGWGLSCMKCEERWLGTSIKRQCTGHVFLSCVSLNEKHRLTLSSMKAWPSGGDPVLEV